MWKGPVIVTMARRSTPPAPCLRLHSSAFGRLALNPALHNPELRAARNVRMSPDAVIERGGHPDGVLGRKVEDLELLHRLVAARSIQRASCVSPGTESRPEHAHKLRNSGSHISFEALNGTNVGAAAMALVLEAPRAEAAQKANQIVQEFEAAEAKCEE